MPTAEGPRLGRERDSPAPERAPFGRGVALGKLFRSRPEAVGLRRCHDSLMSISMTLVWGSVAEWVSGLASFGALIVALLLALIELRARRRLDEDNDKRAARLVVVSEPATYPVGDPPRMAIGFTVHNYGDQPIHDLCVEFPYTTASGHDRWVSMRTVLGPHETEDFDFVPASLVQTSEQPSLWFLDSTGARWRVQAASHEPERVWNYIPPGLPDDIRGQIAARLGSRKRLYRRIPRRSRVAAAE
jgi:hypothetical protein